MAATKAHKGTFRPLQHGPETTALDTVGAAYDLGQHSFQFSLLFTAGTGQEAIRDGLAGAGSRTVVYRNQVTVEVLRPREEWPGRLGVWPEGNRASQ